MQPLSRRFQKRLTVLPLLLLRFRYADKKASEINAVPKLMKSNRITASIPAKARTAVAIIGVSIVTRELENAFNPPIR